MKNHNGDWFYTGRCKIGLTDKIIDNVTKRFVNWWRNIVGDDDDDFKPTAGANVGIVTWANQNNNRQIIKQPFGTIHGDNLLTV